MKMHLLGCLAAIINNNSNWDAHKLLHHRINWILSSSSTTEALCFSLAYTRPHARTYDISCFKTTKNRNLKIIYHSTFDKKLPYFPFPLAGEARNQTGERSGLPDQVCRSQPFLCWPRQDVIVAVLWNALFVISDTAKYRADCSEIGLWVQIFTCTPLSRVTF